MHTDRYFLFLLALAPALASCNIFDTREPDPPQQSSSRYEPPTSPSIVFVNLTNAFLDLNSVNYVASFSDSARSGRTFVFEPTSQARSRYGVFSDWSRQSELQYFEILRSQLAKGTAPNLTLTFDANSQVLGPDTAYFEGTYQLAIPHTRTDIARLVRGRAQFFLFADASRNWYIRRWIDFALAEGDSTWSDIKGGFGQ
ncbi:MAG: hypothetical protein WD295_03980 [Bacteroidota bacterium]